jgi:hypothetical protein
MSSIRCRLRAICRHGARLDNGWQLANLPYMRHYLRVSRMAHRMTRTALTFLFCFALGACASSPVVPVGKDTYQVSSHVAGCISCSASVKSLQVANKYCASMGKVSVIRNEQNTTNMFGYNVGNELIFRCVDENDPEYQNPTLRKDNGVTTIESR